MPHDPRKVAAPHGPDLQQFPIMETALSPREAEKPAYHASC